MDRVASRSALTENGILGVELAGKRIALYLISGEVLATDDECSHAGCQLSSEGALQGLEVECNCHGSRFDLRTGDVLASPANEPLTVFRTEIRGDDVFVDLG